MRWSTRRSPAVAWLLAAWLGSACASDDVRGDASSPPCCPDGGSGDGDGAIDSDGALGEDDDAATGEDGAVGRGDASDADACDPDCGREPVVGVSFQPLTVRTEDGQTFALMGVTGIAFLPGGRGALAWEKSGRVTHYRVAGDELVLLGEIHLEEVHDASDCGLVGLALDPEWETNHHFFVSHCITASFSAVIRYTFDGSDHDAVPETASPVIEVGDPEAAKPWHNIGAIGFFNDEDHSMWLLAGEKDMDDRAQSLESELGKVLRIIPRRGEGMAGYDPHPDNPFAGDPATSSGANIYAWGLRSPWRATIDGDGRIIIGDVGGQMEEVNVASEPGQNFGWSTHNGPCKGDCDGVTDPVAFWGHDSNDPYRVDDELAQAATARVAWVGAHYAGTERDRYGGYLDDTVLFSDMCLGFVRALRINASARAARDEHAGHLVGLSGAAVGPDGYLYATSFGSCTASSRGIGGGIYRVVPRMEEDPGSIPTEQPDHPLLEDPLGPFPLALSDTGLYTDAAMKTPSPRALSYEPTLALWSNGSAKERYIVLPEGAKVDNRARDAWEFPPGTLFFKTFAFDTVDGAGVRIETRVIRRTETGYDYHGYRWRADGSDADLLSLDVSFPVKVQLTEEEAVRHAIPSDFDCRTCHESNDTVVIGFDELRLNGPRSGQTQSQLDALAQLGVFQVELPGAEERQSVAHADATTREVLGYLHGNCVHCHNGSANAMSMLSLEHEVALANIVDVPTSGSGQIDGIRVVPGDAAASVLFQAFSGESEDPELTPMPPIGVQRIDPDAVELLRGWIDSL